MSDGQLIFDDVLRNSSHPITQDLSDITTHGINQAMMDSPLGSRYHTATITKFSDTKEMVMPASVDDMVSLLIHPYIVVIYEQRVLGYILDGTGFDNL